MVKVRKDEKDDESKNKKRPTNDILTNHRLNCHDNLNSIRIHKPQYMNMNDEEETEDLNFTVII